MKKFERLPAEQRRQEIQEAALQLFNEKGFAATTMENIIERVTLSKGGVYRLYPSTLQILQDLMLEGMRLRNAYYEDQVKARLAQGEPLTLSFLVRITGDSLLLYPEFSAVYVEFLWEKQHRPELSALYEAVCSTAVIETAALMAQYSAGDLLPHGEQTLRQLTDLMNSAVLSLRVLGLEEAFTAHRPALYAAVTNLLVNG